MAEPLIFGVHPLGLAGAHDGVASGPPDDIDQISGAIARLQGDRPPLLVRMYVTWSGAASSPAALARVDELATALPACDLVLTYRDPDADLVAWEIFVGQVVVKHGRRLSAVQVTGEANLTSVPAAADGAFPRAVEALVRGAIAAAAAKRRSRSAASIGFAVSPEVDPLGGAFWPALARLGGDEFAASVDYAGLDMYPDVFAPGIELDHLDGAVDWLLRSFREQALPIAGIGPSVPIRICESGWPTGSGRHETRQADVIETVIRSVHARKQELNVTHWELFTLRDADSSKPDLLHNFGILRDDYSPKPAFERLRRLITELA